MKKLIGSVMVLVLAVLFSATAAADVLTLIPARGGAVLDESGEKAVLLYFDLSSMKSGSGRHIDDAILEWRVPGVRSRTRTHFKAHAVTQSWTSASVDGGTEPDREDKETAVWAIDPPDFERHGNLMRLDLKHLVGEWASNSRTNHGILISMDEVGAVATLRAALSTARLTVRYGFVR